MSSLNKLNTLLHHFFYLGMPYVEFVFDEHIFTEQSNETTAYNPLFRVIDIPYKKTLIFCYNSIHSPLLSLFSVIQSLEQEFKYVKYGHNKLTNRIQFKISTNKIPLRWFVLLKECVLPEESCRVRIQKHMDYKQQIDLIPAREWIQHIKNINIEQSQFPATLYIHSKDWVVNSFRMSKFTETVFYKIHTFMVNNNQPYYQINSYKKKYISGFAVRNTIINQWRRILDNIEAERNQIEMYGEDIYTSSIDIPIDELGIIYEIFRKCGVDCVLYINHKDRRD